MRGLLSLAVLCALVFAAYHYLLRSKPEIVRGPQTIMSRAGITLELVPTGDMSDEQGNVEKFPAFYISKVESYHWDKVLRGGRQQSFYVGQDIEFCYSLSLLDGFTPMARYLPNTLNPNGMGSIERLNGNGYSRASSAELAYARAALKREFKYEDPGSDGVNLKDFYIVLPLGK
jgi:hypothetical protein